MRIEINEIKTGVYRLVIPEELKLTMKFPDTIPNKLVIDRKYHAAWASSRGYVWVLMRVYNDGTVLMRTPRTRKELKMQATDLRNINKYLNA
jgi:hypothetical protein